MTTFKIANVLLEDSRQFHEAPTLYVRASSFVTPTEEDGVWCIGKGSCDFTTFFNALSVGKWLEYTVAERFWLHLELRGAACSVALTRAGRLDSAPREVEGSRVELAASDSWRELDLPLGDCAGDVLRGFVVEAAGDVLVRGSHYTAELAGEPREVELALATTTFRKEAFVERNARAVRERVAGAAGPHAGHVTMHVVDNGRTLDARALSGGGVVVHPNPNAGGAGGFARGMMEAMAQERPATHVLLMDDDVEVSPESILRTFSLLSLLRDEWSDAFVSGAMMSTRQPDVRWEDLGFITSGGFLRPVKPELRVSNVREAMLNDKLHPTEADNPDFAQSYAGWWYCCIPTSTIRREGLPLPIFVRYDDVEYSLRCKPRFITMNGICIWHDDFDERYNATVERYQSMRNCFVMQSSTNGAPRANFLTELHHNVFTELTKFNYADAELALDGFEDYLAGPERLMAAGSAERAYLAANKRREQSLPYEELHAQALDELGLDLDAFDPADIVRDLSIGNRPHSRAFTIAHTQLFVRTLNGQILASLKPYGEEVGVIDLSGWYVSYGKVYGKTTLVAMDPRTRRGVIRHRDNAQCRAIWKRYNEDVRIYRSMRKKLDEQYARARPELTSPDFWQRYLGMEQTHEHA